MSEYCPYTYGGHPVKLKYPETFAMPSEKERDRRWSAIRKSMQKNNFDCLIVGAPPGYMPVLNDRLYYISNYVYFANSNTYLLFPLKGEPRLVVSTYIGPQFRHISLETSWISDVADCAYPVQEVVKGIKHFKLEKGKIGLSGFNSGLFSASAYLALREAFPSAALEDASATLNDAINEVSRNSEEELVLLKKSCEILDLAFKAVADSLKPGITECEVWAIAEHSMIKNQGWNAHFMIGRTGPSPVFMRAPAANRTLNRGDIVLFEINSVYAGISPQISWALSLGQPAKEVAEMFAFCEQLYSFGIAELEKDKTYMDIELALAGRIHKAGYEPLTPQIHRYTMANIMPMNVTPQPGDYFTFHPNLTNKGYTAAAKFGDVIRINRDKKVERLNKVPAKLNIIPV
jgi:Xaa-Pro aminopeptidase